MAFSAAEQGLPAPARLPPLPTGQSSCATLRPPGAAPSPPGVCVLLTPGRPQPLCSLLPCWVPAAAVWKSHRLGGFKPLKSLLSLPCTLESGSPWPQGGAAFHASCRFWQPSVFLGFDSGTPASAVYTLTRQGRLCCPSVPLCVFAWCSPLHRTPSYWTKAHPTPGIPAPILSSFPNKGPR